MKMNSVLFGLTLGLIVVMSASPGIAELDLDAELGVKLASPYVWRGRVINNSGVIQPEATLFFDPFTLNIWGTWDLEDEEAETDERTRVDSSLDYTVAWNKLQFKGGVVFYTYYDFPGPMNRDTYEVYVDITADVPFYPSLIIYCDVGTVDGSYGALSFSHSIELGKQADLALKAKAGVGSEVFNENWFPVVATNATDTEASSTRKTAIVDIDLSASLPVRIKEQLTVTPGIGYVTLLDSDLRDAVEDADNFIGSLMVTWEF